MRDWSGTSGQRACPARYILFYWLLSATSLNNMHNRRQAHSAENKQLALQRISAVWNQCHVVSPSRRATPSLFGGNRNPAYCRESRKRRFGNASRR